MQTLGCKCAAITLKERRKASKKNNFLALLSSKDPAGFDRGVLSVDFATTLIELEPAIAHSPWGELQSERFPQLRRLVVLGRADDAKGIEGWETFLARGENQPRELVEATAAAVRPSDPGMLLFSSGSTSRRAFFRATGSRPCSTGSARAT